MWRRVQPVLDYMFNLMIRGVVVATVIHEYSHMLAIRLVGARGYIASWDFNHVQWVEAPSGDALRFVYFAGGFGAFLFFMVLSLFEEDDEKLYANLAVAGMQLGFALVEGSWVYSGNALLMVAPLVPALVVTTLWLRGWVKRFDL